MTNIFIALPDDVSTAYDNPVDELFNPMLKTAVKFDIAVGYFTSGWLRDVAEGMATFAVKGGKSRWVISPEMETRDADSILQKKIEYQTLESFQERQIIDVIKSLQTETRQELCALVGAKVLQFKIAVPRESSSGMFHAKIGSAQDEKGNKIAFNGSYNCTANAKSNWEYINIFKDWEPGQEKRISNIEYVFNGLWENSDPRYDVFEPTKELLNLIEREAGPQIKKYTFAVREKESLYPVDLREYQEKAIQAWGENDGRGMYVMATGSGKTITALATIKKLINVVVEKEGKSLFIVIVLPLKHLVDQWHKEAMDFGFNAIKCYEKSDAWRTQLAERLGMLKVTRKDYVMAMVTNSTFGMDSFQQAMAGINTPFLIVADEAHNLGSQTYLDALPLNATYRLALSATPDRYNDPTGTTALYDYFGKAVINFELKDAIENKFLCPYDYHPHLCPMSELEFEEYIELSNLLVIERKKFTKVETKEYSNLIGKRNDLITGVESKLQILSDGLKKQAQEGAISHTLIYAGSRRGADELRHIERTIKIIGGLNISTRKFTSDESLEDRRDILKLFASGELQSIAAIKCLDEGVDVPATRVAYILASTSNPREFIQRRGRVLRKSPGKEKAIIHDFLVAPPYKRNEGDDMVERELNRAKEFAALALNKDECDAAIKEFAEKFGVTL